MIRLSAQVGGITVELEQEEPRGWSAELARKDPEAIKRDDAQERVIMRRFARALRMVARSKLELPGS